MLWYCNSDEELRHDITAAIFRFQDTIDSVLDFRELDTRMMRMNPTITSLGSIIHDVCRVYGHIMPSDAQLWFRCHAMSDEVTCDSHRLLQIVAAGLR